MITYKIGQYVDTIPIEKPVDLTASQNGRWYVVLTEPNREMTAQANLVIRRVPFYMPTLLRAARISMRQHAAGLHHPDVHRPLFPGVIFVAENVISAKDQVIRRTPGVSANPYMRFGEDLAIVVPEAMKAIQYIEAGEREMYYRCKAGMWAPYVPEVGDSVRILINQVLAGYQGTVADIDDAGRITVLMQIMKRAVRVRVTSDQVEAV